MNTALTQEVKDLDNAQEQVKLSDSLNDAKIYRYLTSSATGHLVLVYTQSPMVDGLLH